MFLPGDALEERIGEVVFRKINAVAESLTASISRPKHSTARSGWPASNAPPPMQM